MNFFAATDESLTLVGALVIACSTLAAVAAVLFWLLMKSNEARNRDKDEALKARGEDATKTATALLTCASSMDRLCDTVEADRLSRRSS